MSIYATIILCYSDVRSKRQIFPDRPFRENLRRLIMTQKKAELLLAAVIVARATSFLFNKIGLTTIGIFNILGLRYTFAFVLLAILFRDRLMHLKRSTVIRAAILSVSFFAIMTCELSSLKRTDSSTTAFLENTAVAFVPLFEAVIRRHLPSRVTVAGTVLALTYMAVDHLRHRVKATSNDVPDEAGVILKRLISIAVPITLSSSMVSIFTLIDTSLVQGQLQNALGYTVDEMRYLYGTYSSGMNLYNLPSSMMTALTISVIPAISSALTKRDHVNTSRLVGSSLRVTGLLAFPMGLGLWALAEPIFGLLYPRYDSVLGGQLLAVLGLASIFVCLMLIANSILQAHGHVRMPVLTMFIGGVIKVVTNFHLTAVPSVNIHAAPIGTLTCFAVVAILNLILVYRVVEQKPNYFALFTKPLAASLLMAFCARGSYALLAAHFSRGGTMGRLVCVGVPVALAVAVYAVLVVALRVITRDDLALLPKGEKIGRLLRVK